MNAILEQEKVQSDKTALDADLRRMEADSKAAILAHLRLRKIAPETRKASVPQMPVQMNPREDDYLAQIPWKPTIPKGMVKQEAPGTDAHVRSRPGRYEIVMTRRDHEKEVREGFMIPDPMTMIYA